MDIIKGKDKENLEVMRLKLCRRLRYVVRRYDIWLTKSSVSSKPHLKKINHFVTGFIREEKRDLLKNSLPAKVKSNVFQIF